MYKLTHKLLQNIERWEIIEIQRIMIYQITEYRILFDKGE